ncbi:putative Ctr copper transporter [Helianthus annuus]|uniref:Copper transport protein n=1 Tax=Helianthus annuus TaxID=4232 RepID=A0A251UM07_HELAN|nr:copper transporter 5.1 [Helianthus annuus]KAF5804660.1 putative Ctr copper transporter [Helianthus annuus]KAJ0569240.1 putative Ctr copper transporter [Helianthus annuus]KAJ0583548.1 putative Ctr copper transporter [Helianthus annuus]KAJ0746277.1 putative Ctr copper transporter [Helianthus annuus]KAJ0917732.1 putative Ctr copper transporter [Helianthus annuus]
MMHMTFYWSNNLTLFINSWATNSWFSYFLTLTILFLFSIFSQFMEDHRLRLRLLTSSTTAAVAIEKAPLLYSNFFSGGGRGARFVGSVLFGINSGINYLLMLAVMSFNGGVFVAIVVGLAVGYWLFRCSDDEQIMLLDDGCACC